MKVDPGVELFFWRGDSRPEFSMTLQSDWVGNVKKFNATFLSTFIPPGAYTDGQKYKTHTAGLGNYYHSRGHMLFMTVRPAP
jgi:hypothetical protein